MKNSFLKKPLVLILTYIAEAIILGVIKVFKWFKILEDSKMNFINDNFIVIVLCVLILTYIYYLVYWKIKDLLNRFKILEDKVKNYHILHTNTRMLGRVNHWLMNIRFNELKEHPNDFSNIRNPEFEKPLLEKEIEENYGGITINQKKEILAQLYENNRNLFENEKNINEDGTTKK